MDEQAAIGLYRTMTRIRQFEKRAYDLFLQNLVKGTTHLGTGQEAIAAGVAAAMRPDDYTFVTYRGHNHVLARGTEMTPVMAELLGRQNGLMHGKGGSMHLLDVSKGVLGSYAIIGAQLVIANGTAWSAQYRGSGQVTVCFFGDGATNIGAFHEALNLAAVWALPVVFICENNHYMEYTAIETVTAVKRPAADRAPAYGLPAAVVDGNDVEAVHTAAAAAIDRAREGGGPSLIEAITYRHGGHSRADPGKYRPADEVAEWLARDPIPAYRGVLISRGVDEEVLDQIDAEAKAAVDLATEQAKAGPEPDLELAYTNVWDNGGLDVEELMSTEVVMPRMGETVDEGTVNVWHKAVGDQVAEGEPLLEIGTDKVDTDIPAPVSGTLAEIRVEADQTVPVGTVVAVIQ